MTEQDPTMSERLHEACWKVIEDTMAERDRALAEVRRQDERWTPEEIARILATPTDLFPACYTYRQEEPDPVRLYPRYEPRTFLVPDLSAIQACVRSSDWREKFHEQVAEARRKQTAHYESVIAWEVLSEALIRIDELEAEMANRSNAPTLGGPLA